jgi:hypothetical protein
VSGLTSGVKSVGLGKVRRILSAQFFALFFWHSFVCGIVVRECVNFVSLLT